MGVQSDGDSNTGLRMKLLIALCVLGAALVVAEPDPYYGYYGYGRYYGKRSADAEPNPYYGYYGYGRYYGKRSAEAEPKPEPYYYGYGVYPGYVYYGKRSADAEPEADPAPRYGYYGGYR